MAMRISSISSLIEAQILIKPIFLEIQLYGTPSGVVKKVYSKLSSKEEQILPFGRIWKGLNSIGELIGRRKPMSPRDTAGKTYLESDENCREIDWVAEKSGEGEKKPRRRQSRRRKLMPC
ncbi:hypothetical protein AFLA70_213g001661 [Aspergillus flavus AF70]|nr:hypothetical protein AFLA70_213g001661 [Aspergillus flavus AF70]